MPQSSSQPRSTFTIAQLCLLTMLSGLLCAWLRGTVERSQQVTVIFDSKLSADGTRLINFENQHGFSVYDTRSGQCLIRRAAKSNHDIVFNDNMTRVCVAQFESDMLATPATHQVTVFDVESNSQSETRSPPLGGWRWWLLGMDPDGLIVDVCHVPWRPGDSPQPDLVRHWDPRSGGIVHQRLIDGLNVLPLHFQTKGKMFVLGASNAGIAQAEIPLLKDPNKPLRDPELKHHLYWFVEWHFDQERLRRTVVPPRGSFLPSLICLNSKRDKALLSKSPGHSGESHLGEHLYLADAKSGTVVDLGFLSFKGLSPGQMTADDQSLIAIETNEMGEQSLLRINLENLSHREIIPPQPYAAPHVSDLKLINGNRHIALASQDGTYRVVDAQTGIDVQPFKHLGFRREGIIWYLYALVGAVWLLLWWRATHRQTDGNYDLGRYAGLLVLIVGLSIGLMLLFGRDEYRKVYYPLLFAALGCAGLGALVGLVLMFWRRCNKLAASFALVACTGMAGYVGYLLRTLT